MAIVVGCAGSTHAQDAMAILHDYADSMGLTGASSALSDSSTPFVAFNNQLDVASAQNQVEQGFLNGSATLIAVDPLAVNSIETMIENGSIYSDQPRFILVEPQMTGMSKGVLEVRSVPPVQGSCNFPPLPQGISRFTSPTEVTTPLEESSTAKWLTEELSQFQWSGIGEPDAIFVTDPISLHAAVDDPDIKTIIGIINSLEDLDGLRSSIHDSRVTLIVEPDLGSLGFAAGRAAQIIKFSNTNVESVELPAFCPSRDELLRITLPTMGPIWQPGDGICCALGGNSCCTKIADLNVLAAK